MGRAAVEGLCHEGAWWHHCPVHQLWPPSMEAEAGDSGVTQRAAGGQRASSKGRGEGNQHSRHVRDRGQPTRSTALSKAAYILPIEVLVSGFSQRGEKK